MSDTSSSRPDNERSLMPLEVVAAELERLHALIAKPPCKETAEWACVRIKWLHEEVLKPHPPIFLPAEFNPKSKTGFFT